MSNRDCMPAADGARPAKVGNTIIHVRPGAGKTTFNVFYDMLRLTEREFRIVRGSGNLADDAPGAGDEPCA
ncbi:hypothetical protein ACFSHT_28625 [Paraburkholderia silviterrae]|uniref:Uncharacterized protein n=1 Tax=Paraburkholderia silviterrae TaxID=2528715 RepID=A0A4V2ZYM9_9BURK|nr:hypothetical protein [Paraburkholderia silviterrae]TDG21204.1 hypothetical protein EYW47_22840 [Paraburkholderia silviterrae]